MSRPNIDCWRVPVKNKWPNDYYKVFNFYWSFQIRCKKWVLAPLFILKFAFKTIKNPNVQKGCYAQIWIFPEFIYFTLAQCMYPHTTSLKCFSQFRIHKIARNLPKVKTQGVPSEIIIWICNKQNQNIFFVTQVIINNEI